MEQETPSNFDREAVHSDFFAMTTRMRHNKPPQSIRRDP